MALLCVSAVDVLTTACDGGDEHHFVAVLEGVSIAAEEPDIFVVDVDVDELAQFAVLVLDRKSVV